MSHQIFRSLLKKFEGKPKTRFQGIRNHFPQLARPLSAQKGRKKRSFIFYYSKIITFPRPVLSRRVAILLLLLLLLLMRIPPPPPLFPPDKLIYERFLLWEEEEEWEMITGADSINMLLGRRLMQKNIFCFLNT